MPTPDRWLLVGSASFVLAAMALIQHASASRGDDVRSLGITLNRLAGIPLLALLGLLSSPRSEWLLAGLLGVLVAEMIGDMALTAAFGDDDREETEVELE